MANYMGWLNERKACFDEAAGMRKCLLNGAVSSMLAWLHWIANHLHAASANQTGNRMIWNIPSWTVGLICFLLIAFYWMLEYAVMLRRRLTPKLVVTFSEQGGIVETPEKSEKDEWRAVYIRGKVVAKSHVEIMDCRAYLVNVQKRTRSGNFVDTQFVDPLELIWSVTGLNTANIPAEMGMYFNIVKIDERDKKLCLPTAWPLTLRTLFDDSRDFILETLVVAEGITAKMVIEIHLGEKWNELVVKRNEPDEIPTKKQTRPAHLGACNSV